MVGPVADTLRCTVLVTHGSDDAVRSHPQGVALSEHTGGALVTFDGAGQLPHNRDPVRVNLLIRQFIDGIGR
jgi:pimeloyl-ACP methyl ester carboxylesterase